MILEIPGYGPLPGYAPLLPAPQPAIHTGGSERRASAVLREVSDVGASGADVHAVSVTRTAALHIPTSLPTGRSSDSWCTGQVRPALPAVIHGPQATSSELQHSSPREVSGTLVTATAKQSLSNSERERINKRRREQRAQERPFFKEMVNAHAEQRQPRISIPTDADGKVIGLKTKWHNSVRSIAKNLLRWDIREYKQYPTEWNWVITSLIRELDHWYTYKPFALCRKYVSRYLSRAISDDRSEWKKHYFSTGMQHSDMPDLAFQSWQPWWVSEEGLAKAEQMKEVRSQGKGKRADCGPESSRGTRRSDSGGEASPQCPSGQVSDGH